MSNPEELPEDIQDVLEEICDQGNEALDDGEPEEALLFYRQALDILPPPAEDWEVYGYIQAAMGDAFFALKEYAEALDHFETATAYSGDDENAFLLMRVGQCHRRLGDGKTAVEFLRRAHDLEGDIVFNDDSDDLAFLKTASTTA